MFPKLWRIERIPLYPRTSLLSVLIWVENLMLCFSELAFSQLLNVSFFTCPRTIYVGNSPSGLGLSQSDRSAVAAFPTPKGGMLLSYAIIRNENHKMVTKLYASLKNCFVRSVPSLSKNSLSDVITNSHITVLCFFP